MDRNMDVIRQIVQAVKEANAIVKNVDGLEDDTFRFHAMLLIEAGLADGDWKPNTRKSTPIPSVAIINRLTWEGFNFAYEIEDDAVWEKAKKNILKPAGSWSFEILREYLQQQIKIKLGLNGGS